ncbi:MAG1360 family OppF-related protein [Mycoplasma sp. AC1221]
MSNDAKFLFVLKNLFEDFQKGFFTSKKNNKLSISIPKLLISSYTSLFFIPAVNTNLTFETLWDVIKTNKSVVLGFHDQNQQNFNLITNKKKILNKISFFDVSKISNNKDLSIPFNEIWKACIDSEYKYDWYLQKITNITNQNTFILKNLFFKRITEFIPLIININQEYKREKDTLDKKISALQSSKLLLNKELEEIIYKYRYNLYEYQNMLFKYFVDFLKELKSDIESVFSTFENSNFILQKEKISELKKRYEYLQKINNTSITKVSGEIKKRDLKTEINYYYKFLKTTKTTSKTFINQQIYNLNKEISLLKYKFKYANIQHSDFVELYKDYCAKRKSLFIWKKNKKNLYYLNNEELKLLYNDVTNKIDFFIHNRYKTKEKNHSLIKEQLKNYIEYELEINVDHYTLLSKLHYQKIINKINDVKSKIRKFDNTNYKQIHNHKFLVEMKNLNQQLQLASAELDWSNYVENKIFDNLLTHKNNKINQFSINLKNVIKSFNTSFKKVSYLFNSITDKDENSTNIFENLSSFYNSLIKKPWMINLLEHISEYCSNKKPLSKTLLNEIIAMLKFVSLLENISISQKNFLIPFKYLKNIDKIKIKLIKYWVDDSKLLIIKDLKNDIPNDHKNEFIRVLNVFSQKYKIPYIYTTDDFNILKNEFDEIFLFNDRKLVESGDYSQVISKPFTKFANELINEHKIMDEEPTDAFFINEYIINLHTNINHQVYTNLKTYKQQGKGEINQNFDTIIIDKTQNSEQYSLTSVFNEIEFDLSSNSENNDKENAFLDYDEWNNQIYIISSNDLDNF